MKLSVWTSYYVDLSPEDAILEYEKHGYHYSELSDEHTFVLLERGEPEQVGKALKAFAAEHNFSFPQGHLFLRTKICEPQDREVLKKQLRLFNAIGIKNAVLHCDNLERYPELSLKEKRERNLQALKELTDFIADTDMVICLENLKNHPLVTSVEDILSLLEAVNSPHLGICLDTGHLNLCEDKDQEAFIRKAGKHLKALHLTDNEGGYDQHIMPYGRGTIDFVKVVATLKEIGYEGLYNLEIPGDRLAPLEILGYKLDYIREMFGYLDRVTG